MSMVAFLASVVSHDIASVAAQAALGIYSFSYSPSYLSFRHLLKTEERESEEIGRQQI